MDEAQEPVVLRKTRKKISGESFIPNVVRNSGAMRKYICPESEQFKTCKVPETCIPRCKEEWTEWEGGCEEKYCSQCCDLVQTRELKLDDKRSMRGGTPPTEITNACWDSEYFWGYEEQTDPPQYREEKCKTDSYIREPWFGPGKFPSSSALCRSRYEPPSQSHLFTHTVDKIQKRIQKCEVEPKGGETLLTFQAGLANWGQERTQKQAIAFQYTGNENLAQSGSVASDYSF